MHLEVAPWGWLGAQWAASYPVDLPEEWRLDYLANECEAVVVPAADWRVQSPETLHDWLSAAPAGFHFYWEVTGGGDIALLRSLYAAAPAQQAPAGCLLSGGGWGEAQQRALAELGPSALCLGDECRGESLVALRVAAGEELRQLRARLDTLAGRGDEWVLLLVHAAGDVSAQLQQLQTFCQLYRS